MARPTQGDKINIIKLAHMHFQEGRWDKAIEEYSKLIELDPQDMNVHNILGDAYAKKNDLTRAFQEYSIVSADYLSHGLKDKAAQINKKIACLDKNHLSTDEKRRQTIIQHQMKAEDALEANRVEEAIESFREMLKLDSEDLAVVSRLAELEEKIGHISVSVEQYTRLGLSLLKSHLFKKAQEMFKKVLALDPQNMEAHLNLAQIYTKHGSESDAKKEYLNRPNPGSPGKR